jgi:hypothetical protein
MAVSGSTTIVTDYYGLSQFNRNVVDNASSGRCEVPTWMGEFLEFPQFTSTTESRLKMMVLLELVHRKSARFFVPIESTRHGSCRARRSYFFLK